MHDETGLLSCRLKLSHGLVGALAICNNEHIQVVRGPLKGGVWAVLIKSRTHRLVIVDESLDEANFLAALWQELRNYFLTPTGDTPGEKIARTVPVFERAYEIARRCWECGICWALLPVVPLLG